MVSVISEEDRKLLLETKELLEELLETLEIMSDEELVESVRRSEEDVRQGRTRPFEELLDELKRNQDI